MGQCASVLKTYKLTCITHRQGAKVPGKSTYLQYFKLFSESCLINQEAKNSIYYETVLQ